MFYRKFEEHYRHLERKSFPGDQQMEQQSLLLYTEINEEHFNQYHLELLTFKISKK